MAAGNGATWPRAQRPQDRQAARDAWRSSSLTQPPSRCSRSALLTLLIAPAEPDPEGLPGAGRLQLGSETAARTCQRAACGLPAAAALRAAGALSASPVCSGPAAAGASLFGPWSVLQLLGVFGGAGGAARGIGREQKRSWWSRFEWSTGFEFLTVFSMPPAPFRCQLNRQRQSRHPEGADRTLVCIQRTPGARAMAPPS